jgi:hypothetical protein
MATTVYTGIIEKEGDLYAALCPELDVASQGATVEEAVPQSAGGCGALPGVFGPGRGQAPASDRGLCDEGRDRTGTPRRSQDVRDTRV